MRNTTLKKALSLFLAVLMVALALPFTLLTAAAEESSTAVEIVDVTLKAQNSGGGDVGFSSSTSGALAKNGILHENDNALSSNGLAARAYFDENGEIAFSSEGDYYGIIVVTLAELVKMDAFTLWTPNSKNGSWFTNNAYDIFYSTDGSEYTSLYVGDFTEMKNSDLYEQVSVDTFPGEATSGNGTGDIHKHEIDMNNTIAKYVAIAVKETLPSNQIILHEVTATGTPFTLPVEVVGMQPNITDSDLYRFVGTVNSISVKEVGFKVDIAHKWQSEPTKAQIESVSVEGWLQDTEYSKEYGCKGEYNAGDGETGGSEEFAFDGDLNTFAITDNYKSNVSLDDCLKTSYFDETGKYGYTKNTNYEDGYYCVFFVKLNGKSKVDTFSIWANSRRTSKYFGPNGYDIWYSADGVTYQKSSSFSNINDGARINPDIYVAETWTQPNGTQIKDRMVHHIDMNGVEAEYIAIAVTEPTLGQTTNHNTILYELTVDGSATETVKQTASFTDGTNTVYTSIYAAGESVSFDGKLIYALALDGIPQNGEVDIDVTPYFIPQGSDVKVYGEVGSFSFIDGEVTLDTADTVSVMTYNLNNGIVDYGGLNGGKTLSDRVDDIVARINYMSPDVVVLTEAHNLSRNDYDLSISSLVEQCDVNYAAVDFATESTNVILYNDDKYDLAGSEVITLANTAQDSQGNEYTSQYTRTAVFALLERVSDGRVFAVVGTHFDFERTVCREQARDIMEQLANYEYMAAIIAGDFNLISPAIDSENGSSTLHKVFYDENDFVDVNTSADKTATFPEDGTVIDYIYIDGAKASGYTVVDMDSQEPSDHYPVYVELTLN